MILLRPASFFFAIGMAIFTIPAHSSYEALIESIHQTVTTQTADKVVRFSFEKPKILLEIRQEVVSAIPELLPLSEIGQTSFNTIHGLAFLQYLRVRTGQAIDFAMLPKKELPKVKMQLEIALEAFRFIDLIGYSNTAESKKLAQAISKFFDQAFTRGEITLKKLYKMKKQIPNEVWVPIYNEIRITTEQKANEKTLRSKQLRGRKYEEIVKGKAKKICQEILKKQEYYEQQFLKKLKKNEEQKIEIASPSIAVCHKVLELFPRDSSLELFMEEHRQDYHVKYCVLFLRPRSS